ncbi:MAG: A/G-specific adenine glycosylase [Bacteroidetes bacterium]|nr:A/G-specific adenine glycosylase [Bacteroidota bacterium]
MERWFSAGLQKWYGINKRNLPWREVTDPYKIWLSEIILQQTQVAQGLSYYNRFVSNYPTVKHLALATEDEVLKDWQGLGYYSRARNLHEASKYINQEHKNIFPDNYVAIKELKGVGDYTASAIASFAFNLPYAVVDGNVYRVLSRIFGIETAIDSAFGKKEFQQLANDLLDRKSPATHNQAIMEFGSQCCKPVNPNCEDCIFKNKCFAFKHGLVSQLPFKEKKAKVRDRFFNYLVMVDKHKNIIVNKRQGKDIWKGLYEFPLIETKKEIKESGLLKGKEFLSVVKKDFAVLYTSKQYKHVLSHQHLYAKFYVIKINAFSGEGQKRMPFKALEKLAFPRLIEKFLNDCKLNEIC